MTLNFFNFQSFKKAFFYGGIVMSFFSIVFMILDIRNDLGFNKSLEHLLSDFLITLSLIFLTSLAFKNIKRSKVLKTTRGNSSVQSNSEFTANAISIEFEKWGLTEAEKKVANYILVGVSYAGIADLLDKSERTVRQQAISIYSKSGLKNRARFTGAFIDLIFSNEECKLYTSYDGKD